MSEFAVVILAHADPVHVRRLVGALPDVRIFLHCDAKAPRQTRDQMTDGLPTRVTLCPPHSASLASWSLVEPELAALRLVLATTSVDHIAICSGADYPLVSVPALEEFLAVHRGGSLFSNRTIPFAPWSTARNSDGGLWRFNHRFLTRNDNVRYVRGIPLRWPVKRKIPDGLELRAASQWKIYSRRHAELLLSIHDEHPALVRFWRTTLVPEESFAASVLGSPALAGDDVLSPTETNAWYIHWPNGNALHPSWLGPADFGDMVRARAGLPAADGQPPRSQRALFARKFSTRVDTTVLDRIDDELRR